MKLSFLTILTILLPSDVAATHYHVRPSPPPPLHARLSAYSHPLANAAPVSGPPAVRGGVRVSPLDYGADPLGLKDSSAALALCVQACVNYSVALGHLGVFPTQIANAGGCEIDLGGGAYLLAKPVVIPVNLGNLRLGHGSLVADDTPGVFPADSFLIVVGDYPGACSTAQDSCNVDLGFPELFLDGRHVASALQINSVMGTTVGPGSYFLNFSSFGVQINGGHEVMLDRCWLGESNFDYIWTHESPPKATAIQVNGNDHDILNTVVFSSKIGLEMNGAANNIFGVHVWFPWNTALSFLDQGVLAFRVTQKMNRFTGCYIDGGRALFTGDGLSQNTWVQGFECCASVFGDIPHGIWLNGSDIEGMVITHNIFRGGNVFATNTTTSPYIRGTRIDSNTYTGNGMGTRATITANVHSITSYTFDFCSALIYPIIAEVKYSLVAATGFPVAIARPPVNCTVLVEFSEPMTGQITMSVDSARDVPGF